MNFNLPVDIVIYNILIPLIINPAPTCKDALQPIINLSATNKAMNAYYKELVEKPKIKPDLYKALLYNDTLAIMLSAITTAQEAQKAVGNIAETSSLINPYHIRNAEDLFYINKFVVNILKQKGASLNDCTIAGNSPLLKAIIHHNQTYFIEALLAHNANVNQKNEYGSTPLMIARKLSKGDVYTILLKYGADLNAQDNNGHTINCICYSPPVKNDN